MDLLTDVERHLKRTGMTATQFGRAAMNDRGFVPRLRAGREPREATAARVRAWLAAQAEAAR